MANVLVIGSSGALGQLVCHELRKNNHNVIVSDYKIDRGTEVAESLSGSKFIEVDVKHGESIRSELESIDSVIVTAKKDEPLVQKFVLKKK